MAALIASIVAIAVDILGDALIHSVDHPDIADKLVRGVRDALAAAHAAEADPEEIKRQRMAALAAGMAADRANAVQAMLRRKLAAPKPKV